MGVSTGRRRALAAAIACLVGIGASVVAAYTVGLRVNLTPSLPIGLYVRAARGTLVEFCPPGVAAEVSAIRGYRGPGVCPDRHAPLLKPVVGRAGDVVDVDRTGMRVNGRALPNTQAHPRDHRGRSLEAYPPGRYRVAPGTLWVASTWNDGSFDSRYFGPIDAATVRSRLAPLWVIE
jgi:conjugative transfer signal peptidase TraF